MFLEMKSGVTENMTVTREYVEIIEHVSICIGNLFGESLM